MNHLVEELRKGAESGVLIDCATLTAAADEIERLTKQLVIAKAELTRLVKLHGNQATADVLASLTDETKP